MDDKTFPLSADVSAQVNDQRWETLGPAKVREGNELRRAYM